MITESLKSMKLVIIDDDERLISSFIKFFQVANLNCIVGAYKNVTSCYQRIVNFNDIFILLDMHIGDKLSHHDIPSLKRVNPRAKVIIMSNDISLPLIIEALSNGADGYVMKEEVLFDIGGLINQFQNRYFIFTPSVVDNMARILANKPKSLMASSITPEINRIMNTLTKTQRIVLGKLLSDSDYNEIANEMGIARNTVSQHIQKIYKAFVVKSRMELIIRLQN